MLKVLEWSLASTLYFLNNNERIYLYIYFLNSVFTSTHQHFNE